MLAINIHSFCWFEKIFHFWNSFSLGIEFWVDSSFSTLKMSLHCILTCIVSKEGSAVILIFVLLLHVLFSLTDFKMSSFPFVYRGLNVIYLGVFCFVVFILPSILWDVWNYNLVSLILRISQPLFLQIFFFFKYFFLPHFLSYISFWHSSNRYVQLSDIIPQLLDVLFLFWFGLFLLILLFFFLFRFG